MAPPSRSPSLNRSSFSIRRQSLREYKRSYGAISVAQAIEVRDVIILVNIRPIDAETLTDALPNGRVVHQRRSPGAEPLPQKRAAVARSGRQRISGTGT